MRGVGRLVRGGDEFRKCPRLEGVLFYKVLQDVLYGDSRKNHEKKIVRKESNTEVGVNGGKLGKLH